MGAKTQAFDIFPTPLISHYPLPLKIPRHLVQLLAIRILISNTAMKIYHAVGIGKMWCIRTGLNSGYRHYRAVPNVAEPYFAPLPADKTPFWV